MAKTASRKPPERYVLGQELNWKAPWVQVQLWVELPFWLMVNNATIAVEVNAHTFKVEVHDNYWELHVGQITDSKSWVCYQGPFKKPDQLSREIRRFKRDRPAVHLYRSELCRAHIPVVNRLVQQYRLATYDYFAYEVAPWDVPRWGIERDGRYVSSFLMPYRTWDFKPAIIPEPRSAPVVYRLVEAPDLQRQMSAVATAGEFELLDSRNFMERGDYSGAVRRVTTAIEVLVEDVVRRELEAAQGGQAAGTFLERTRTRFDRRLQRYEQLSKRMLPDGLRNELRSTRALRHAIVHNGYRIGPRERGRAQRSIDTGRWIFDWFENDPPRKKLRETKLAHRGLGRDLFAGIFSPEITADGVVFPPLNG